jgi:hypothetical protein
LGNSLLAGGRKAHHRVAQRGHPPRQAQRDEVFVLDNENPCGGHGLPPCPRQRERRGGPKHAGTHEASCQSILIKFL